MSKRLATLALGLCCAAALVGCSSSSEPFTEHPLNGIWDAVSIDGEPLPYEFILADENVSCVFRVEAVYWDLRGTGRYVGADTVYRTCTGFGRVNISRNYSGRWRAVGNTLFLTEERGAELPVSYTLEGSTLTLTSTADGQTMVTVLRRR